MNGIWLIKIQSSAQKKSWSDLSPHRVDRYDRRHRFWRIMMIDSLLAMISHGTELSAAAGHTSQTAFAAVLCAALFNFFG
ncbi:YshB family small membrane protein [Hafnia paralvei]